MTKSIAERLGLDGMTYEEWYQWMGRQPCTVCGNPNKDHDFLTLREIENMAENEEPVTNCAGWEEDIASVDPSFRVKCWHADCGSDDRCDEAFMEDISS